MINPSEPSLDVAIQELRSRLFSVTYEIGEIYERQARGEYDHSGKYDRLAGDWLWLSAAIDYGERLQGRKAA